MGPDSWFPVLFRLIWFMENRPHRPANCRTIFASTLPNAAMVTPDSTGLRMLRWLQETASWLGLAGWLGVAAAATPPAAATMERAELEARVAAVRQVIQATGQLADVAASGDGVDVAQWFNWPNWGNWNNWPNWGNWGNWFNR